MTGLAFRLSKSGVQVINSYDGDGNLLTMQRNGSSNNIADNFSYNYYTNTNKVQRVSGSVQQFTYDLNGNVTGDSLNHLYGFKYDYRNLITEFRRWEQISTSKGTVTNAYRIDYYYDEAGNRVKKALYKWQGANPIPFEGNDANGTFNLLSVTYYVRDVSGKEIAIYTDAGSGINLDQWNVYGLDNIGKIDPSNHRFMYLKDHLGSVRAIIDTTNTVVYAQDYDPWGYPLENRTYDAGVLTNSKYKFTAKERDKESGLNGGDGYDYFGARYYNSRIANWTSIDPLLEKHFDYSPYNYVLRNPLRLIDPDGRQADYELKLKHGPEDDAGLVQNSGRMLSTEEASKMIVNAVESELKAAFNTMLEGEASTGVKISVSIEKGVNEKLAALNQVELTEKSLNEVLNEVHDFVQVKEIRPIWYSKVDWERVEGIPDMTKVGSYNKSENIGSEVRIGKDKNLHNDEFHFDFQDPSTKIKITFYKDE